MGKFVLKRFFNMILVMLGVSVIVFLLLRLSSGDPAYIKLSGVGIPVTDELLWETREAMGLNLPMYEQFWNSFTGMLTGDLGVSYRTGRPVLEELLKGLGPTLKLAGASFLLTVALSVPLGIVTALYANRTIDYVIRITSFLATAMPLFALGLLLIYIFSLELQWLPVSGSENPAGLALPALSLSLGLVGRYTKQIRASVLDEIGQDYVRGHAAGAFLRCAFGRHGSHRDHVRMARRGKAHRRGCAPSRFSRGAGIHSFDGGHLLRHQFPRGYVLWDS